MMTKLLFFIVVLAIVLAIAAAAAWGYINIRARRLDGKVGAFRCWSRPDKQSGWTAGIGLYGAQELSWYRLVAFSNKPVYTVPRCTLELSAPIPHSHGGSLVQVRLISGDKRYEVVIASHTYNALVAWIESCPPERRG